MTAHSGRVLEHGAQLISQRRAGGSNDKKHSQHGTASTARRGTRPTYLRRFEFCHGLLVAGHFDGEDGAVGVVVADGDVGVVVGDDAVDDR